MNLLNLEKVSKTYTDRKLFDQVTLGVNEGDRVGLIGINGAGKSTLLKIIAGLEKPDEGEVVKGNQVTIAYLSQTPVFDQHKSIIENVIEGKEAKNSYHNLEGQATSMLAKLGITNPERTPEHLSGGERKRMALVRTLLTPAKILVLDEPTNHLDNDMTEWLEEYLKKWNGSFIMITHDRYFLDRVTNKIVELDKGKLYTYEANYSKFIELKAAREESVLATERKNKSLYRMELAWMQRGARARSTKQKAHIERFEKLKNREAIQTDGTVVMGSVSQRLGRTTVELENVSKAFNGRTYIRDFTYILLPGDRVGIVGHNGCGKSTLLKILTGTIKPDSGNVTIGETVKIGYFTQENEHMDESKRVIDYIKDTAEYIETIDGKATASQMCEQFLFTGAMQYSVISKLSGGEKRRLYLLKILMEAPNILVLDEPTNDLDIATLTILEDYLQTFKGIVITVSHDRYFLDKTVNRIFAFAGDGSGNIVQIEGGYTENLEKIHAVTAVAKVQPAVREKKERIPAPEKKKRRTYNEQREWNMIDAEIEKLEQKLLQLDESINESTSNYSKLTELSAQKEEVQKQLDEKMERWVYLSEFDD